MTDLAALVAELKRLTAWQRTPRAIEDAEYLTMIINGIEYLYILTGRGNTVLADLITVTETDQTIAISLNMTEKYIVLCSAQIELYEKVRADKNAIVGYTTDALTVTNADKPYRYLSETIEELRQQIRVAYYKLTPYVGEA